MNPLYFSLLFSSGCSDSRAEGQWGDGQGEHGAAAATESRDWIKCYYVFSSSSATFELNVVAVCRGDAKNKHLLYSFLHEANLNFTA